MIGGGGAPERAAGQAEPGLRWVEAETLVDEAVDAAAEHARQAPEPARAVDWWTERLVDAAELEAAVGAAFRAGGPAAAAAALRRHTLATARGLAVAHAMERRARAEDEARRRTGAADAADAPPSPADAAEPPPSAARAHAALAASAHLAAVAVRDAVAAGALDREVPVRPAAAFADGGLYPETYAAAARQFAARVGPARALVVGVRGAGTGLAAVVADTLQRRGADVHLLSLPPGDDLVRALADRALDAQVRERAAAPGAWAAVVDEGPSGGGGSFAAIARALVERGFDPARVVFFPRLPAGGGAAGPGGAHREFAATFDDAVLARGGVQCHRHMHDCELVDVTDAAGNAWRVFHCASDHGGDGPVHLTYVGLGRAGRARAEEAARRAAAGEGPRVFGWRRGFLVTAADAPARGGGR